MIYEEIEVDEAGQEQVWRTGFLCDWELCRRRDELGTERRTVGRVVSHNHNLAFERDC